MKVNIIESTPIKQHKLLGVKGFELISYAAQVYAAMVGVDEKGFELISYAAQVYAAMLGADEIRIMKPTSSKVRSYYCSMGYEYVSQENKPSLPDYWVMKLR